MLNSWLGILIKNSLREIVNSIQSIKSLKTSYSVISTRQFCRNNFARFFDIFFEIFRASYFIETFLTTDSKINLMRSI